jgi:hypothetical protein
VSAVRRVAEHDIPSAFCEQTMQGRVDVGAMGAARLISAPVLGSTRTFDLRGRLVGDTRYAIHHVGARWGDGPFPRPAAFSDDFVHVLYEGDVDGLPGPAETRELRDALTRPQAQCRSA